MVVYSPFTLYKISLLLFLCSFFLVYLFTPIIKRFSIKFKILDEPSLERKIHEIPMPSLGGLAIFVGFILTLCLLYLIISYHFLIGGSKYFIFNERELFWIQAGLYLICCLLILLVGALDDLKSIDFRLKLFIQMLAAAIIIFGGIKFNFLPSSFLNITLSFLWIVGLTNSFNLLDNMNGLSCGLSIIIIGFFILLSYVTHHYLLTLFLIIPLGCLLGFLPYNFPKAEIFLGDCGSLFIGFSLATYSLWLFEHLIKFSHAYSAIFFTLILLFTIPFCDMLTVISIRIKNRKPIYVGDMNHLSHQLMRAGFSSTTAVMILYFSSFIFGILGLGLALLQF